MLLVWCFIYLRNIILSVSRKSCWRQHIWNPFLLPQPPATDHQKKEGGQGEHPAAKDTFGKEVKIFYWGISFNCKPQVSRKTTYLISLPPFPAYSNWSSWDERRSQRTPGRRRHLWERGNNPVQIDTRTQIIFMTYRLELLCLVIILLL